MSRGPWAFKPRDIARAVKGARAAGLNVTGVRVGKDGAIEVVTGNSDVQDSKDHGGNEWDAVLSSR